MSAPLAQHRRLGALMAHVSRRRTVPSAEVAENQFQPLLPARPRTFRAEQADEAVRFFDTFGFCVLSDALSQTEVEFLLGWYERSQRSHPQHWRHGTNACDATAEWLYHQPLLDFEELDQFVQHPGHFRMVSRLLGGVEHARFSEFDLRETPVNSSQDRNWHRDIGEHGFGGTEVAARDEFRRSGRHNYICSFHYLNDVTPESPAFGVIPQSCVFSPVAPENDPEGRSHAEQMQQELSAAGACEHDHH